jgi:hypothetical protein
MVDTNRSGAIEAPELQRALAGTGDDYDLSEVQMMMNMFDKGGNPLDFSEFVALNGYLNKAKQSFSNYDRNGRGELNNNETQDALMAMHGGFFNR